MKITRALFTSLLMGSFLLTPCAPILAAPQKSAPAQQKKQSGGAPAKTSQNQQRQNQPGGNNQPKGNNQPGGNRGPSQGGPAGGPAKGGPAPAKGGPAPAPAHGPAPAPAHGPAPAPAPPRHGHYHDDRDDALKAGAVGLLLGLAVGTVVNND